MPHHMLIELCLVNIDIFFLIDKPENVQLTTNASANKACQNDILKLTCSVGDANPEVTSYQLFQSGSDVGESNTRMWVKTLSTSGLLMYKCVANNSVGSSESPSVSITVNGNHGFRFFISTSFNPARTAFFFTLLALVEWSAGRTRNPDVLGSSPALATLDLFFIAPS